MKKIIITSFLLGAVNLMFIVPTGNATIQQQSAFSPTDCGKKGYSDITVWCTAIYRKGCGKCEFKGGEPYNP